MNSLSNMPSPSSLFAAYASMAASMMLVRSMANDLIPRPVRDYLFHTLSHFFMPQANKLTLVIEEQNSIGRNQVYDASEIYLCTKIGPHANRLKVIKSPRDKNLNIRFEKGERIDDSFEGIDLTWKFIFAESESNGSNDHSRTEKRYFELSFDKKYKEKVLYCYLPWVLNKAKEIKDEEKVVKLCTLGKSYSHGSHNWNSINFEHPSTFETLAMDPDQKKAIIEDLDRFVKRKEFYKKVGRAWKRGYLLYGPPGTGKSSLIAAMANYLKFDVYDLQLGNLISDSDLRRLLLGTANRSILVIEDIDCSVELQERGNGERRVQPDHVQTRSMGKSKRGVVSSQTDTSFTEVSSPLQLTLSGLLNFIDGLWSTCGDERIIIFTTNHKERLDPALLRPGRMDMHIHMSYCTIQGFKVLASNYLGISEHHKLYGEIEGLLENAEVTPAEVAEELMKSDDAKIALGELSKLLKRKAMDGEEVKDNAATKVGFVEAKRLKVENKKKQGVRNFRRRGTTRRRNL